MKGDPGEPNGASDLRSLAAVGVKWSLLATAGSQIVRLGVSFVLARMLGPTNFGVVALAYIYLSLAVVVLDQGFGLIIIQRKQLDREDLGTVTAVNAIGVVGIVALSLVVAPWVADFFHEPKLTDILRVLTIGIAFRGLSVVPQALLARRLRFRALAVVQLLASVVGGVVGVASALAGAEHWALVAQSLTSDGLIFIGALLAAGPPVIAFSRRTVRTVVTFSAALMLAQLLQFVGTNSDNALIGRFRSARELAFYVLAYRFLQLAIELVSGIVSRVSLPMFSRVQDDMERLRNGFVLSVRSVTMASFAGLTLLVLLAPDGLPLLLGSSWQASVLPLQLLAGAAFARVVLSLWAPIATALARTDLVLLWTVLFVSFATIGFVVGLQWGINGVAASLLIVSTAFVIPNAMHVGRIIELSLRSFLTAIVPALVASAVQALAWFGVDAMLDQLHAGPAATIACATPVALVAYIATIRIGWPGAFADGVELASMVLRGKRPAAFDT